MDEPNRRRHIFGEPRHNSDPLVRECGGEPEAYQAIVDAVDEAFARGDLVVNQRGKYKQAFDIRGHLVTVTGQVVNGIARVGTAWIPS
jgi:hypothetical protein